MTTSSDEETFLKTEVAQNVRRARQRAGLSQGALARACGVSRPAITRIEQGRGLPSLHLLYRIGMATHTHPGVLLTIEEDGLDAPALMTSLADNLKKVDT